jgi:Mn-containing catalase
VAHQKSFEKALYAIVNNFSPGKLPGLERYANAYVNTSQGAGDAQGSWNSGAQWQRVDDLEKTLPVDGGDGAATVDLPSDDLAALRTLSARTTSRPDVNPGTGVDLGAGPGAGKVTDDDKGGASDMSDAKAQARSLNLAAE